MDSASLSALIMFGGTASLLLFGAPIGVSIGLSSFFAMVNILPMSGATTTAAQRMFTGLDSFALLAIPFFILAGNIMNNGGIAIRLINCSRIITGYFPGALAQTNIVSNMLFGSISGSGVASAAAIGGIMNPIQKREGYDSAFRTAVNVASAPTGMLIPPSNTLIVYATVAGSVSVSALFMGGYLPGLLWGGGVMLMAGIMAYRRGYISKNVLSVSDRTKIFIDALPSLSLVLVVIGGILSGVFTPTEASAIAVVYSLVLAISYKSIKLKDLREILLSTSKLTAVVIYLISASSIMSWVMAFTQIPNFIAESLLGMTDNAIVILLVINVILLIVGTFMDPTPAVLIFTPIFLPICVSLGMDPVHFGIMLVFNLSLGTITPPVGPILFTGCKVSNVKIDHVIKTLSPFFLIIFAVLMVVTFIPEISMILPKIMGLIK